MAAMDSSMVEEASSVGEDYLLLDTPMSEETKPFEPTLVDMDVNATKEDLDAQLTELRGIMSRMGLDSKSVDPEGAGQSGPPHEFVQTSQPHHQDNVKTLENELLNLALDKASGTCLIEGWETLLPPLPDSVARFARVVSRPRGTQSSPFGVPHFFMVGSFGGTDPGGLCHRKAFGCPQLIHADAEGKTRR